MELCWLCRIRTRNSKEVAEYLMFCAGLVGGHHFFDCVLALDSSRGMKKKIRCSHLPAFHPVIVLVSPLHGSCHRCMCVVSPPYGEREPFRRRPGSPWSAKREVLGPWQSYCWRYHEIVKALHIQGFILHKIGHKKSFGVHLFGHFCLKRSPRG